MPATCVPQYVPRANTGLSKHGDPVFPHFWSWNQNLARVCARGGGVHSSAVYAIFGVFAIHCAKGSGCNSSFFNFFHFPIFRIFSICQNPMVNGWVSVVMSLHTVERLQSVTKSATISMGFKLSWRRLCCAVCIGLLVVLACVPGSHVISNGVQKATLKQGFLDIAFTGEPEAYRRIVDNVLRDLIWVTAIVAFMAKLPHGTLLTNVL